LARMERKTIREEQENKMKFKIETCQLVQGNETTPWEEDYDKPEVKSLEEAIKCGRQMIDYFNSGLRPKENPRKFISARIVHEKSDAHQWEKHHPVTLLEGHLSYDLMRCKNCGIKARRYGLGQSEPVIEKKFQKKFKVCPNEIVA